MHVAVTPLGSTDTAISVKVTAAGLGDLAPTGLTLRVDGDSEELTRWRSVGDGSERIWYSNHRRPALEPGQAHHVELLDGEEVVGQTRATTLPSPEQPIGLIFGSCFDSDQGRAAVSASYDELARRQGERGAAVVNLWFGDQVYLDAPWQRTILPTDPEETILAKYRATWAVDDGPHDADGLDMPEEGLAYAMSKASNWYLPDDHEFWNGYPHPSFLTLPFHTAGRLFVQIRRWFFAGPDRPSHPYAQGRWGRMAGEAYCAFQSDVDFEEFGEDVNPPQLQQIDLGHALIVMADTRWHRTIRKTGSRSAFMLDQDLEALTALLQAEDRMICLCLARPLAGHLPDDGPIRDKAIYAAEDYCRQYIPLWQALNDRAAAGKATLILGGDLHAQSVSSVLDNRLLEVVSSPLALLVALDSRFAVALSDAWVWIKSRLRGAVDRLRRRQPEMPAAYPMMPGDGTWQQVSGRALLPERDVVSGTAAITIDAADPERPIVVVDVARIEAGRPDVWSRTFRWNDGWIVDSGPTSSH